MTLGLSCSDGLGIYHECLDEAVMEWRCENELCRFVIALACRIEIYDIIPTSEYGWFYVRVACPKLLNDILLRQVLSGRRSFRNNGVILAPRG